ncbi:MAG: flagellar biosynthesis anti-sigma factor FlgM [Nitrospinaceae bacterium]|nr:flagellar biosynthesis anti-sigma factor FlgM [Nitrospinaceae bacterium]NIR57133.1 flagellar biosynthesis anti-sigma factor FlgM [Nitrospinaceae bacterium]NIS87574.1 flagellar biosynthesis anti-sigma factor FlgM [Nitrospinaceae bacterium]NIT84444.1 flagellar biosynthesis anti-sigma factor FlgM [Nitrospinaceae bacterium]NIU46631.1 flagellar biosynthesis anti-sigma factor FlgM [Nitrospinaceae bacterium]
MEIPGNDDLRIRARNIQDRSKVGGKAETTKGQPAPSGSRGAQGTDKISVSEQARLQNEAIQIVQNAPENVRSEKVERIKRELEDGTLKFDSRKVAEKILKDLITETEFLG